MQKFISSSELSLSLSLFVFLGFCFFWLQLVSAALLQQVSPPALLQQVSLALFYQVYFKKALLCTKEGPSTRMSVPELCRCKMWFPIFVWTNFPENWETAWHGGTVILDLSVLLAVSLSLWLNFWSWEEYATRRIDVQAETVIDKATSTDVCQAKEPTKN